tara:strand:+ start:389 stop:646 length:258 start_codon:yes stop_codon:yes gene_type:complete
MKPTKHSELRIRQRGIKEEFVKYAEYFLSPVYENQCYKIFLTKKKALQEAKLLRKMADIVEKHAGTEILVDSTGSSLITAYRRSK